MGEFATTKIIAQSAVATPLALEASTRYGLATPANEDRNEVPLDVYVYTPGGDAPPENAPSARDVCRLGVRLASLSQFQWQEVTNGKNLALHFVAVHPAVTVEPGATVPKFATVASIPLEDGEETWGVAIDTRLMASFTQPAVNGSTTITVFDIEEDFPPVGKRLFIEGGGFYEVTSIDEETKAIGIKNLGLPGAIVTLAS